MLNLPPLEIAHLTLEESFGLVSWSISDYWILLLFRVIEPNWPPSFVKNMPYDLDYVRYHIHGYLAENIYIVGDPSFIEGCPLGFQRGFWVSKILPKNGVSFNPM